MKNLKYFIIPYIALGLVLSMPIGITYYCYGSEMFPEYFGSPFVFKQKSLGSSMTYFYSVSGLLLNVIVGSIPVIGIRLLILYFIKRAKIKKMGKTIYKGIVVLMLVFSTLNIAMDYIMMGNGFYEGGNYWYMDLDKEAQDWGMECKGKWGMFRK